MKPHSKEVLFYLISFALLAIAVLGHPIAQSPHYHAFADSRAWLGIANLFNTLSNVPFLVFGVIGMMRLVASARTLPAYAVFFCGLILTAIGSSWYHLAPDNHGLAVDRFAMAVSFAGIVSIAVFERIGDRAGLVALIGLLVLSPSAVAHWAFTGNALPWAVAQFGGLLALCALALVKPIDQKTPLIAWWQVVALYAIAKAFEHFDHEVFELTKHALSGHSLKHFAASLSALPVLAIIKSRETNHNYVNNV